LPSCHAGHDGNHLKYWIIQSFLTELFADLSQRLALGITELYTSLDLVAQDTVFGHQVFISKEELLID
jgi:hypothetical protein